MGAEGKPQPLKEKKMYETPEVPKKKNNALLIGVVVAVLLCCCCLLVLGLGWTFGDAIVEGLQSL